MNTATQDYRALPVSERIQLVEDIWDSIEEDTRAPLPLSADARAELYRRMEGHRADPSSSIPWEQVRTALFRGVK